MGPVVPLFPDASMRPVEAAARAQRLVSDPGCSAWVDASAGSGKTKVLVDRALRLMMAGARPERVLCLTFTKAAAAEMANRIVEKLAGWATASETQVRDDILAMAGRDPDAAALARARTLFARVVDAPGGLKVQTVHAFCQAALERFPVEAGAPPGFAALDERAAADLLVEARDAVLRRIMSGHGAPELQRALDRMAERGDAERLDAILAALLAERGRLAAFGGPEGAIPDALRALGFADEAQAEAAAADAADAVSGRLAGVLKRLADACAAGSKTDCERADRIAAWLALDAGARAADLAGLCAAFFTASGDGEPFTRFATRGVVDGNPWLPDAHADCLAAVEAARERVRSAECALDTVAALRLAAAVGARYESLKGRRAALDFDDLILKTRDLLQQDGGAGWALYKLDQGVDHILVDEAQDTNPEQWQVVHALAGEFYQAGRAEGRTLFAVGDPKQSIFSFQRADPAEFKRSREVFAAAAVEAGQHFEARPLDVSFRSVDAVLRAVDATFAEAPARDGLAPDGAAPTHRAAREGRPGLVELWPTMPPVEAPAADPWTPLLDYPETDVDAETRLAHAIARKIADLLADRAERVGHSPRHPGGRRIRASDVMVVVQNRRRFGDALARELKRRGVETAGVDRMRLSRQLVVRDLIALGQVAVLPEDDLSLAALLKSPLGGLDEPQLFRLAHGRGRQPLWRRLKQAARDEPAGDVAAAWALVEQAMARADYAPPFDFYHWALGPMQGRARLVAAMGAAAEDPIGEFMALALRHAAERPASLSGFLAWIERDSVEVKRATDGPAAGVRLLTAHAAKGLQAPVVFLADTTRSPPADRLRLHWAETPGGRVPLLGPSRKARDPQPFVRLVQAKARAEAEERRRLLYVAMTRAEDRLYVAGWQTGRKAVGREDGCWHELVEAGFDRLPGVIESHVNWSDAPLRVLADPGVDLPAAAAGDPDETDEAAPALPEALPAWWDAPAASASATSQIRAPSRLARDDADGPPALSPLARGGARRAEAARFGRGLVIHKLLERLPALPPAERERAGRAYLRRVAAGEAGLDAAAAEDLLGSVLALMADPALGDVFAADALAEAPIAGRIGGARYAGVIDRLALAPGRAVIVDYKTNRPPPATPERTPEPYLRQMALYRALARQAFPDRSIVVGLLWTEAPRLDRLGDALLDAFAPDA